MRFNLVDRIVRLEPGKSIQALKNLTLAEDYLADHFPTFPVMPGVLMLQSLVEAGAWLLRVSDEFQYSVVVLREAKNVKYGHFMEPGRQMEINVELVKREGAQATLKGKGEVDGNSTVAAQIVLARYNLRDHNPALESADEKLLVELRSRYALLRGELQPKLAAG